MRRSMKKADLHVHSRFSAHPSEWFLQRLGTRESYTTTDTLFSIARARGMDFVTITDHNQIEGVLQLQNRYPDIVFTGVESTAYFPEDGCKVHILIYGLTAAQFAEIERIRTDIYCLRDYLKSQKLPHSVAHATFSVNKKLTVDHVYKLLLLFDYFETVNGARTKRANNDFFNILINLLPVHFEDLRKKYQIEPFSNDPWRKGFTGGSDDHSGLQIGETYTTVKDADTPAAFLEKMMQKKSFANGRHNDYRGFAFSIYKIACDFSKDKSSTVPASVFSTINKMLFEGQGLDIRSRFAITRMKMQQPKKDKNAIGGLVAQVLESIGKIKSESVDDKFAAVYDAITHLSDELLRSYLMSIENGFAEGDVSRLVRSFAGILPVTFLSLPFISTIHLMNESRSVQEKLDRDFGLLHTKRKKRVAWFTDTITDLNGPSETIKKLAWMAFYQDYELVPVVCLLPEEKKTLLPPNVMNLPVVWQYTPPFFSLYTLRIPSILASIKKITEEEPDEILISTPGPIGLLGLLIARLLHIPCKGIYHTDFTEQAACITEDESVCRILEEYVKWFYSMCDEIKVPTREYISILEERGFRKNKMSVFKRGIEADVFTPQMDARIELEAMHGIPSGAFTLLFAGRISAEKQVDKVLEIFRQCRAQHPHVNLLFAGNGPEPYYSEFRKKALQEQGVYFLGRLRREQLPLVYSAADLLVFPSTTDTFGMVVLEAQACGLPALVADIGGPQEIIIDKETGFVLPNGDTKQWVDKIDTLIAMRETRPEVCMEMRNAARQHVVSTYDWQAVLQDIFADSMKSGVTTVPHSGIHPHRETSSWQPYNLKKAEA